MSCAITVIVTKAANCPANADKDAYISIEGTRNCVLSVAGYKYLSVFAAHTAVGDPTIDFQVTVSSPGCKTVKVVSVAATGTKTITVHLTR